MMVVQTTEGCEEALFNFEYVSVLTELIDILAVERIVVQKCVALLLRERTTEQRWILISFKSSIKIFQIKAIHSMCIWMLPWWLNISFMLCAGGWFQLEICSTNATSIMNTNTCIASESAGYGLCHSWAYRMSHYNSCSNIFWVTFEANSKVKPTIMRIRIMNNDKTCDTPWIDYYYNIIMRLYG